MQVLSTQQIMNDVARDFYEVIRKQLLRLNLEVIKVVPLPSCTENADRLKILQNFLSEVQGSSQSGTLEYWVQLKPHVSPASPEDQPAVHSTKPGDGGSQKPSLDGIYLPNGKLNVLFLLKNAEILFEAGDYRYARKIYKSILHSGEYTGTVLYRLGRCFEAEGKLEEACTKFEEAIIYNPSLESYQRLSALLVRMNKEQQAAEVMERAQVLSGPSQVARALLR